MDKIIYECFHYDNPPYSFVTESKICAEYFRSKCLFDREIKEVNIPEIPECSSESILTTAPRPIINQILKDEENAFNQLMNNSETPQVLDMLENMKRRLQWCINDKHYTEGKFYSHDREIDILEIIIAAAEWKEE